MTSVRECKLYKGESAVILRSDFDRVFICFLGLNVFFVL